MYPNNIIVEYLLFSTLCFFLWIVTTKSAEIRSLAPGFLYYTSNSGYLASGSLTRLGDRHVMQSILSNDCALELEMWLVTWCDWRFWRVNLVRHKKKRMHTMDKFMIINVIWVYYNILFYNYITINRGVWYLGGGTIVVPQQKEWTRSYRHLLLL